MRPVDTAAIQEGIHQTQRDRDRLDDVRQDMLAERSEVRAEIDELASELRKREQQLEQRESDLADVKSEIERIEARLEERETLEADRKAAAERLQELHGRIDRIETDAVEHFNEHMAEILGVLDYENVERIWIERKATGDSTTFDLQIVRSDASGTVYEDTVDHLSESEREVAGLVFALAGYLGHDVHEVVPIMELGSLEAIDSERIADLLEYFHDYSESILVALLPEDAAAVKDDYTYVRDI